MTDSKQTPATKKEDSYFIYDFVKLTAGLPGLLWFRPKVWYESPRAKKKLRGGALLISNHIGVLDPVSLQLCVWYRRHHFVCLKDFFERPVSAWLFRRFHCIPVDRENFQMSTLRVIVELLKKGKLVSLFPEGHMAADAAQTDAFKSGMVLMAAMSKKPIVPVYLVPRKHFYSRIHMVMGEPVEVVGQGGAMPTLAQIDDMTAQLFNHEARLRAIFEDRKGRL